MDTFTFMCSLPTLTKKSLKTIHALAQTYRSRSTLNAHVSTSFDKAQERGRSELISSVATLHKARMKSTIASPDNRFESWNKALKLSGCNCSSTCCDGGATDSNGTNDIFASCMDAFRANCSAATATAVAFLSSSFFETPLSVARAVNGVAVDDKIISADESRRNKRVGVLLEPSAVDVEPISFLSFKNTHESSNPPAKACKCSYREQHFNTCTQHVSPKLSPKVSPTRTNVFNAKIFFVRIVDGLCKPHKRAKGATNASRAATMPKLHAM
mmetsp:Transcript_735/g.2121  ORF Transcript_735/g.2121 Transcript_735/m.2121 type:complete len:271 (-) Transcript_735:1198-2010(-)